MITRIDFIGQFSLAVPQAVAGRDRPMGNYLSTHNEWRGWEVEAKGAQVFFRHPTLKKVIEMPRSACIIYSDAKEEAK